MGRYHSPSIKFRRVEISRTNTTFERQLGCTHIIWSRSGSVNRIKMWRSMGKRCYDEFTGKLAVFYR